MSLIPKLLGPLFVALVMSACTFGGFGDPTRNVDITNSTGQAIHVFTFDRDPRFVKLVAPGDVWRDTWMYPLSSSDKRKVRVEADTDNGQRIYCADFGYDDLQRSNWKISITVGVDKCRVSPDASP